VRIISDYGKEIEIPEYVNYRGKRYEARSSHTHFKDVAQGWAKSDKKFGHKTIVKTFKSSEKGKKIYVLYRCRQGKEYDQKTGKVK